MRKGRWLLLVGVISFSMTAHAEKFMVGDKVYKTAEEARAAVDSNRIAWINSFNPNGLLAYGFSRVGGKAIFLMPDDQYIRDNFEYLRPQKSIFAQKKPTDRQEYEFIRSLRLGIESTPLIFARLEYFDSITSVPYNGDPSLKNLDSYNADYVIYLQPVPNSDLAKGGISIAKNKKALHEFKNIEIKHVVKNLKNGNSIAFFSTKGSPYLFYDTNFYSIVHSLSYSIKKITE